MAVDKSDPGDGQAVQTGKDSGQGALTPGQITAMALALMTVSSVASLRPAPTMAVYGLACVFLYVLPAIVFLIPTALVSAELASGWDGALPPMRAHPTATERCHDDHADVPAEVRCGPVKCHVIGRPDGRDRESRPVGESPRSP